MGQWPNNGKCDRCGIKTSITTMSMFNTDHCCLECINKEKKHPDYKYATQMELLAIQTGNYNFQGVGLPDDL